MPPWSARKPEKSKWSREGLKSDFWPEVTPKVTIPWEIVTSRSHFESHPNLSKCLVIVLYLPTYLSTYQSVYLWIDLLGAVRGTELRWQREPKKQIFAENRRFSQIHPFSSKFKHGRRKLQKTADFRRKPKIVAENRRKPLIGLCHPRCVTFSSALDLSIPVKSCFLSLLHWMGQSFHWCYS